MKIPRVYPLLAVLAMPACSAVNFPNWPHAKPVAVKAAPAADSAPPVSQVMAPTSALAGISADDSGVGAARRIVERFAALKRTDQRVALANRAGASPFEIHFRGLLESELTSAGFHIIPAATPAAAKDDRVQLATLSVDTTLHTNGKQHHVQLIARVIDRADVVLACVETITVSPADLRSYQPEGTYLGTDRTFHESPIRNFRITRGE